MRMAQRIGRATLASLLVVMGTGLASAQDDKPKGNTAIEPAPREGGWMKMHEAFLERTKQGPVDLLFLGDSITQGWGNNATWQRHYGPRHAANFGIGGDRTQHVLWRLEHGEIDGISPKVAVLMIGTNNVSSNTPDEIAEGIKAIVAKLRKDLPKTKILLLAVFPRGASGRDPQATEASLEPKIGQINEKIQSLGDGKMVTYLDIGPKFLNAEGKLPKDVMPDFLHLSAKGYRIWADAIEPTLWKLMDEKGAE